MVSKNISLLDILRYSFVFLLAVFLIDQLGSYLFTQTVYSNVIFYSIYIFIVLSIGGFCVLLMIKLNSYLYQPGQASEDDFLLEEEEEKKVETIAYIITNTITFTGYTAAQLVFVHVLFPELMAIAIGTIPLVIPFIITNSVFITKLFYERSKR